MAVTDANDHIEDSSPAVTLEAVTRTYVTRSSVVVALDRVTAELPAGALTVVAGPSGSGKSTLINLVACIDRASTGAVRHVGHDVGELSRRARRRLRRQHIGVVLPRPSDNLLVRRTVEDNVTWAWRMRDRHHGTSRSMIDRLMALAGLTEHRHKRGVQLSGGEQQRLALVCAAAGHPRLLAADEPTASLDQFSAQTIVTLLDRLKAGALTNASTTVVVATHDAALVAVADHLIQLDHGRIAT